MLQFVLKRTGGLVVVLVALSLLVFLLQGIGGADPVRAYLGANASKEAEAAMRAQLGLDQPILVQYLHYVGRLFTGDLGTSLSTRRPVAQELVQRVPATLELALWAIAFAVVIGLALAGVYSMKGRLSAVLRFVFFAAASAPSFLIGTLGLLILFARLHWVPAMGRSSEGTLGGPTGFYVLDGLLHGDPGYSLDAAWHLLLPALAASLGPGVALARMLADGLTSGMRSSYARTARSLGESERSILRRHSLRNAASPALSLLGVQLGMMLSSLVVVEQIFSWNGLGQYLTNAIGTADIASVAAVSLVMGAFYVVVNAVVDVLLAVVDPRVRLS